MPDPTSGLPARPSLEQLRKQAKELLHAARVGDATALSRLAAVVPESSGAVSHAPILADAQLVIAREHGFPSWPQLVRHIECFATGTGRSPIRPHELTGSRTWPLPDGGTAPAEEVWRMFVATHGGDLDQVKALIARAPGLARVEYNYTPPIHFAVREGHLRLVHLFLDRGADLAYRSYPFGDSLLTMAEDREHYDVAAFLRERLSRRFALGGGISAIIDAARAGDLSRVRAELARDGQLARRSNDTGDTPLHHAAHRGHLEMVNVLLAAGASADAVRGDGYRPIHLALMPDWLLGPPAERSNAIADALLAHGVRYTTYLATLRGDISYVREALRRDRAEANAEDTCHHRPISAAVRRRDVEMVRLLLDHGAAPSLPEEGAPRGHALWIAVHDGRVDLVRMLLEHGADPNGMVESSGTPILQARKHPELLALLRAHGGVEGSGASDQLAQLLDDHKVAEVEELLRRHPELVVDDNASWGEGILAGPANSGDHPMLALLMRLGATVPPVSKWAPYYYFKHEATAAFLLDHGMDANHMNWHRFTLLHHMAAEGELGKARLLLDHGATLDAVDDEYGSTPLGVAARRGQLEAVRLLLRHGASVELAAAPWATPLAWAVKKGHDAVADVLRAHTSPP